MEALLRNKSEYSTVHLHNTRNEVYFGHIQVIGFVFDNFEYTVEENKFDPLAEADLTAMCMAVSESSLKEGWDSEDDAYWESYLKE